MNIINKPLCQICEIEQALGAFRSKWVCGRCMLKFESKIRQERNKFLDIVEKEIKEETKDL